MPRHEERQLSPYSPKQLFDLVADVEKYPEFLPWCRAARILSRDEQGFVAELMISFAHMSECYTSRVDLTAHERIEVRMTRGPFHHLDNLWKFTPTEGGTQIDFMLDFAFKSKLLESLIGGLFAKATAKMTDAFRARADALYGGSA